jgi:hypothetical protein
MLVQAIYAAPLPLSSPCHRTGEREELRRAFEPVHQRLRSSGRQ